MIESTYARFVIAAMSIGALSPETHRTIAVAMNSISGRSNTGCLEELGCSEASAGSVR